MPHKILVVEDDLAIQGFCQTVLESAGFQVTAVSTAKEALAAFKDEAPDLLICDIGLPDGNGHDLVQSMGLGPDGSVPFIFLTAREDLNTRLKCFQQGAQDYIQKPFAVEELLARVKLHLKVKKSHDDLAKKNYELELRARVRQDLADMLVHDLKAPLTSIKGTLELIKARGLISNDAYKNLLENAGTAAEFMLLMLNDLLDIGQAQSVGLKTEIAETDMDALSEKLIGLFAGRSAKLGISIEPKIAPTAKVLQTDQNLVFRVLANLVQNAMKVSSSGDKIGVLVDRKGAHARLVVADRGPGVPKAERERIFEKYATTGRKSATLEAGSGVGLTFCRMAAQGLKGKVWVEDRDGGGSLFIFEIPAFN
jgi:signal transduction histidine kinase